MSTLFDGVYKELWRRIVPEALTQLELELLLDVLNIKEGDRVLDAMCGYGRHTLGLAKKGIAVTAIDNAADYITEINKAAEGLPVEALAMGVESFKPDKEYQAAICMGNSISTLNREQTLAFFKNIRQCLQPGGRFLLNTWMITEVIAKKIKDREWYQVQEFKYLLENEYLLHPSRIETRHTVIAPDGKMEEKLDVDYIFSMAEMEALMAEAGLTLLDIYSTPRKRPWSLGDEYIYFLAGKI
ncbi:MAG: methyltransferase domain-containing protein [Chitinophagaceae bacterium]|nr:methyltransferase domain-containing protein [Chitinophagaceae bacterium]